MSSIEVIHTQIVESEEYPEYEARMNAVQDYLYNISKGSWKNHYATHTLLQKRKYFASENVISVTDVEELLASRSLSGAQLCLNNPEKFVYPNSEIFTPLAVSTEYTKCVMESYPGLSVVDGVVQLFYIDVVSVDRHSDRLLFITREAAEQALKSFLEAM